MRVRIRILLAIVLSTTLLVSGYLLTEQLIDNHKAAQAYANAQALANIPPESVPTADHSPAVPSETLPKAPLQTPPTPLPKTPPELPMDDQAKRLSMWNAALLQQVNPDVIGWIHLPDTPISYPLLHTENNSTYLHTAWDGTENKAGSIFLETRSDPDFEDFNTIIYGHHMRNGSMFAALLDYKDSTFHQSHPCVYLVTEHAVLRYEIFAAYEASVTSDTYRLLFKNDTEKQVALQSYLDRSLWEPPLTPVTSDKILTMSTCTGNGTYETRWVVQAVRTGYWQKEDTGLPKNTGAADLLTVMDGHSEP